MVAVALSGVLAGGLYWTGSGPPASAASPNAPAIEGPRGLPALTGRASVIDGDTLDIGGRRVRLEGIDAPEVGQACNRTGGETWSCGSAAANALSRMIGSQEVACENHGNDKYGRMLGICFAGTVELNREMVRQGQAWAFVKYSQRYVAAEGEARTAQAGIWQGETDPAWIYRERRWASAETAAPEGCAIKGNITRQGHIYHMPWSPWYGKVKIETTKGERWFCSEAEAQAAGWRPAMAR